MLRINKRSVDTYKIRIMRTIVLIISARVGIIYTE